VRIAYSPRAVTDLAEIGDYLAERNPNAAAAVEQRMIILHIRHGARAPIDPSEL